MSAQVKLSDIIDGMDAQSDETTSYLNKKTGETVIVSEYELTSAEFEEDVEELSEWEREAVETAHAIRESNDYIALPSKWDIHEYHLMERFCLSIEDERLSENLYRTIKGRGAFRRFKSAIHKLNIADEWYAYRGDAFKRIAIDWCEENEIEFIDDQAPVEMQKPQRLSRKEIYRSPWVNLYLDRVRFPDGRIVEDFPLLDFEMEAVAVVVQNADQEILMIQSYRYTTDTIEWEIPAGGIEEGESILAAAKREVLEETGYTTDSLELIYTYNPMNGLTNKVFHLVKGRALETTGNFDRNEVKAFKWCSVDEIKEMIVCQTIKDGFALTGLLLQFMHEE